MLLEHNDDGSSTAYRSSTAGGAAVRSHAVVAGLPSISSSGGSLTETGQRPPSPRSLLASAKAGSVFVTSNCSAGVGSAPLSGSPHISAYHPQDSDEEDADDDSNEAHSGGLSALVRMGSLERASNKPDRTSSRHSTGSDNLHPPAAAAAEPCSPAASSSSTPRSKRRESLQR